MKLPKTALIMRVNDMGTFKLAESFVSINGEGRSAGELALFMRFVGCNLQCDWCDTKWANGTEAPYTEKTVGQLAEIARSAAEEYGLHRVTLTGGEPLLQKDIAELIKLREAVPAVAERHLLHKCEVPLVFGFPAMKGT